VADALALADCKAERKVAYAFFLNSTCAASSYAVSTPTSLVPGACTSLSAGTDPSAPELGGLPGSNFYVPYW
jgi:hypothetical protein